MMEIEEDRAKIADDVADRLKEMGITNPNRVYDTNELAPGRKIIFAACGVTDGPLLRGVRFFGTGKRTESLLMTTETRHVRFVNTVHLEGDPDAVVRFDH
jgi:fructose-1,6-bisphosphatase/sedoheptulose 1,7-bisphosphatase-like protein